MRAVTAGSAQILKQVEALLRAGNLPEALRLSRDAVDRGAMHPNLLTLAAFKELESGTPERALERASRALALSPRSAESLHAKAIALARLGRHGEAVALYDEVLRLASKLAAARYNKASSLGEMHEWALAQREFERVLELEPAHAGALANLAALAAARGEAAKARDLAGRALGANPGEIAADLALAQLDLEAREFELVRRRVAKLLLVPTLTPVNRAIAHGLLADALDGLGLAEEAFKEYARANQILHAHYRPVFDAPGRERAIVRARRLAAHVKARQMRRGEAAQVPAAGHLFLIGFPRSGTTLLEQILASHPDIEALEERDCLAAAIEDFVLPADGLARLDATPDEDLRRYRDAYWAEARKAGAKLDRKVFVDKLPLNALNLSVIARLFPSARILLALRDPRDVVLSCFRRRFEMSPNMYELLTLEDTAAFYSQVMDICLSGEETLPLSFFRLRYEDLVADLEGRARAVAAFLGLAFDPRMLDFAETARRRGIMTPSAAQVARGLYRSGMGQWRAYRAALGPAMPILEPWIARLGYEKD